MGICSSNDGNLTPEEKKRRKAEKDRTKALENKCRQDHEADQQINKLLLLGAGESGKSTLFKQMITIYGKGFPEAERKPYVSIIANNIISSCKNLATQSAKYTAITEANQDVVKMIHELKGDEELDMQMAKDFQRFWADPGTKATYEQRAHYQLTDSTAYFFDKIMEIGAPGYIPSEQDVLRSRVRTTGIVENSFEIDGNGFKMYDVGGQRNERKKWIHCFESVTAVLFVAAISAYDQVLYEDETTNRMIEALNLFEEICNSRWFRETAMILFLNKRDLFAEKIQKVSLRVCFPEYSGGDNYDAGTQFLQDQFTSKNRNPEKQIYSHITCATDTSNVEAVFNAAKDIIIRRSLNEAGLV